MDSATEYNIPQDNQQNVIYSEDYTNSNFNYQDNGNTPTNGYIYQPVEAEYCNAGVINEHEPKTEKIIRALSFGCLLVSVLLVIIVGIGVMSDNAVKGIFKDCVVNDITEGESGRPNSFLPDRSDAEQNVNGSTSAATNGNAHYDDEQGYTTVTTTMPTTESTVRQNTTTTASFDMNSNDIKTKIAGKWSASLPYKAMKIPAVFTFDSKGKCSCVIKALFITKKFDGKYTVEDDGTCSITLYGLEDYVGGSNTMVGKVHFVNDNKLEFKSEDNIWILIKEK